MKNSKGQLLELDGTKYGPRVIAEKSEDLLKDVAREIMSRVDSGKISESLAVLTLNSD